MTLGRSSFSFPLTGVGTDWRCVFLELADSMDFFPLPNLKAMNFFSFSFDGLRGLPLPPMTGVGMGVFPLPPRRGRDGGVFFLDCGECGLDVKTPSSNSSRQGRREPKPHSGSLSLTSRGGENLSLTFSGGESQNPTLGV